MLRLKQDKESILKGLLARENQFLSASYLADLETPVSTYLKLTKNGSEKWSFLLESVEGGEVRGRYSFIGFAPDCIWKCVGNQAYLNTQAQLDSDAFEKETLTPFESLARLQQSSLLDLPEDCPPQVASLVGYIGYDMVRLVEKLPPAKPDVHNMPDSLLIRPSLIAVVDNVKNQLYLIAPIYADRIKEEQPQIEKIEALYHEASQNLNHAWMQLEMGRPLQEAQQLAARSALEDFAKKKTCNISPERYKEIVQKAKDYIIEGDIFQVVLSQRYDLAFPLTGFDLYRSLRRINPSPFLFHLKLDDCSIIGSSPEILVRKRDNKITIRPIAGTRKRGENVEEDRKLAEDLLQDTKEKAEHLMLLDLGRNDVGRVAKNGSVRVTQTMGIEYYSHVMHMTSNVEGEVEKELDPMVALMAGFPAGTVTGAPKIRAMEIIDELEQDKRGIYAGCIGYFGADGSMDTCIALRTAIVKDGTLSIQAGAGIVSDSLPENEHQECQNKAQAIIAAAMDALEIASPSNMTPPSP